MGFVGKVFKSIFSPSIPSTSIYMPSNTQQSLTGRDLVASTESAAPEAPIMGGTDKKKRRGIESLLVPSEYLFKGGN